MAAQSYTAASGVILTGGQTAFLKALRAILDPSVPLHVTSGVRDAGRQAEAMLVKYRAGGAKALYDLYAADSTITKLVKTKATGAEWTKVLKAEVAAGARITKHMGGGSLDIQTKTLTGAQVQKLLAAVKAMGATYIQESTPPHLHVDLPAKYAVASAAEAGLQTAREGAGATWLMIKAHPWRAGGAASVLVVLSLFAWMHFKKKRAGLASSSVTSTPAPSASPKETPP